METSMTLRRTKVVTGIFLLCIMSIPGCVKNNAPNNNTTCGCLSAHDAELVDTLAREAGIPMVSGTYVTSVDSFTHGCDSVLYTVSTQYRIPYTGGAFTLSRKIRVTAIKSGEDIAISAQAGAFPVFLDTISHWYQTLGLADSNVCTSDVEFGLVDSINTRLLALMNPRTDHLVVTRNTIHSSCDTINSNVSVSDAARYFSLDFDIRMAQQGNSMIISYGKDGQLYPANTVPEWCNKLLK
jgi:hypothetical protein